jgi:integrase
MTQTQATALLWRELAEGESPGTEEKGSSRTQPPPYLPFHARNPANEKPIITNPSSLILSPPTLTMQALRDKYLDWLHRNRSPALWREAKRHLDRWCETYGQRAAIVITGTDLEAFQESLISQSHALMYVRKHSTSIRACFNKGVRMGWLPASCKPFATVESIRLDPCPLLESDLPTDAEVKSLLTHAEAKPMLHDIVSVYHATGCRTHELIEARCGDFQPNARTIVLGKHKRSRTLREPIPRTIHLNATAYDILKRRCGVQEPSALIFPNRTGKPFTSVLFDDMFARLRKRAGVRDGITPYSFRHLYISEMLMAGVDAMLVARMAGTSVKMIETVYGHFRTASYADAQAKLDATRQSR